MMRIQPVRGTHDIYGIDLEKFNTIEKMIKISANSFGFDEIITKQWEKELNLKEKEKSKVICCTRE